MSVVIQIDVEKARRDVEALNAGILSIAANAGAVKTAFGGADLFGGIMGELQAARASFAALTTAVDTLNATMAAGASANSAYSASTQGVVTSAQAASKAILGKVQSLQQARSEMQANVGVTEQLSAADAQAALRWTSQEKVIRSTITAMQLKKAVTKELADLELSGQITTTQSLRYQENMRAAYLATGTAAEKLLATLREQNSAFLTSNAVIAEHTSGYKLLTATQQSALKGELDLASAIKLTSTETQSSGSAMDLYDQKMLALNLQRDKGVLSQDQYIAAIRRVTAALDSSLSQLELAAKAMRDKSYADSAAAAQEKAVQDAIASTSTIIGKGIDPVVQYTNRLKALNLALQGTVDQGGNRVGINQEQYAAGLRGARTELEKNITSSLKATSVMGELNSTFGIGTQAAAGFRAGMQGAGLGFGIFTGQTIVLASTIYAITKGLRETVSAGVDFQERFSRASAVLGVFDDEGAKSASTIILLQSQIMGLAESSRFSSSEVTDAAKALGQAGLSAAESMATLPSVLNLATVGEISTTEAGDKLVNTMKAFNLTVKDSTLIADQMTKAALVSTTTIGDLSVGLGQVGETAHAAGIGLDVTLGALSLLKQVGIQASKTGTDLRTIIQSLADPTTRASAAFQKLHIDTHEFFSGPGGALDLVKVFETLKDKIANLSKEDTLKLGTEWFGKRASGALQAFLSQLDLLTNKTDGYIAQIDGATGASQKLADVINANVFTAFKQFKTVLEDTAINSFAGYSGELTTSLKEFTDYVKSHGPEISNILTSIARAVLNLSEFLISNAAVLVTAFAAYEGFRISLSLIGLVTATAEKGLAAFRLTAKLAAADAVADAAALDAQAISTNSAAVATARLTVEMEAEIVAAEAAAVANGAVAAGAATSLTAMSAVKSVASGLLAIIGGWPALVVLGIGAVGYVAYETYQSLELIKVPVAELEQSFIDVKTAAKSLDTLDYSGLQKFSSVVQAEIENTSKAIDDLQHNIDSLNLQSPTAGFNVATIGMAEAGLSIGPNDEDIAKSKQFNAQQQEQIDHLKYLKELVTTVNLDALFASPSIKPFADDLETILFKMDALGATSKDMALQLVFYFNSLRQAGKITEAAYTEIVKNQIGLLKQLQDAADLRNAVAMGPPAPLKTAGITLPGKEKVSAELRALGDELKSLMEEFDKASTKAGDFGLELAKLETLQTALSAGKLDSELKKLNITMAQAQEGLDHKIATDGFTALKAILVSMNPAFKDITDSSKAVIAQTSDLNVVTGVLKDEFDKLTANMSGPLKQAFTDMYNNVISQLVPALDGIKATTKEFQNIIATTPALIDKSFKGDGIEEMVSRLREANVAVTDHDSNVAQLYEVYLQLGGSTKAVSKAIAEVNSSESTFATNQRLINGLLSEDHLGRTAEQANLFAVALKLVNSTTEEGALIQGNKNLENQISLLQSGTMDLTAYNAMWKQTKGGILPVDDAITELTKKQILLNEQFSKMQAVQATFKSFAGSLSDAFATFFTSTDHNWKTLTKSIQADFKTLLQNLIKQAIENQILFYFGFNQSGAGGGGGSLGSIIGAVGSFFGGGAGGGAGGIGSGAGGANSGWDLSSLAGLAAQNNSGGGGGGGGGLTGAVGYLQQGSSLFNTGKTAYGYFTGAQSNPLWGAGSTYGGSTMFGSFGPSYQAANVGNLNASGFYGNGASLSYQPSALGYGATALAAIYAGYQEYNQLGGGLRGVGGAVGYGLGTAALGLGAGSVAAGGTFAAGIGGTAGTAAGLGASSGVAAAIPIIGWVALAAMLVDHFTGGKIFGSGWAPKDSTSSVSLGATGAMASNSATMWRYQSQLSQSMGNFGLVLPSDWGKKDYKTQDLGVTPAMQAAADKYWKQINDIMVNGARQLGVDVPPMIDATLRTVTEYDKKGKVTATNFFVDVLGRTWQETSAELASTRVSAEALLASIAASAPMVAGSLPTGTTTGASGTTSTPESAGKSSLGSLSDAGTMMVNEAELIAERWRSDATLLMDGAQFLLTAQTDILHGNGLLKQSSAPGVLTATADVVDELAVSGEKLNDTYLRLVAETGLVNSIMLTTGNTAAKSGADFVRFSDAFVQAMGGLPTATAAWNVFASTVYKGVDQVSKATSSGALTGQLAALGLSATTTIDQFAVAFKKVAGSLSASDLALWVKAGASMGAIVQGLNILQGMADGVDISSLISQQQATIVSVNAQIDAAAKLGASEDQLAQMREAGRQAIQRQLGDFMGNIQTELGKFEGGAFTQQLKAIHDQMMQNIDSAKALGASTQDLADIQRLAAYQTAAVIVNLEASLTSLIAQFHGASGNAAAAAAAAQRTAATGQSALNTAQKALYDAAQKAMNDIATFLKSLQVGPLSTQDWQGQLNSASKQFTDLVTKARGGDQTAMSELTQYAQTYLQQAQNAYGNSSAYQTIFDFVTTTLQSLSTQFAKIAAPPAATAAGSTAPPPAVDPASAASAHYMLALQIANQIGALGLSTGVDIYELMTKFGTNITELSSAFGINLHKLDDTTFSSVTLLAHQLGISSVALLTKLGATPAAIGAYFKVSVADIAAGNLKGIATMATALGTNVWAAITFLGVNLGAAVKANGVDITKLTGQTFTQLATIAGTLGVSIVDLLNHLNVSIATFAGPLAQTISNDLSTIPGLAAATVAGLMPLITALGTSITAGDLNTALTNIGAYLSTLPDDQRTALQTLFTSLGLQVDATTTATNQAADTQTTIAANTNNANSHLNNIENGQIYANRALTGILSAVGGTLGAGLPIGPPGAPGNLPPPPPLPPGGGNRREQAQGQGYMSAGDQLFHVVNNPNSVQNRAAQAAQDSSRQIGELGRQVDALTRVIANKLDQVNMTQGQTRDGVVKMNKQAQKKSLNTSVRK